ncbi:MAG: acyl carrier protein [Planctomycetota bacterium]
MPEPETLPAVIELVRETLALDPDTPVAPTDLLFYDHGFTSMDLLDLLFRVEERFAIKIPEGTLAALSQGALPPAEFQGPDGVLTPEGRAQLMALLHDTPPETFPERVHRQSLPRYCTVAAIARLAEHQRGV